MSHKITTEEKLKKKQPLTFIICAEKKVCCLVSTYFQIIQVYIPHSVITCDTEYVQLVGMLMENFAIFATLIFSLTIQQALGKRQRALTFLKHVATL
jgi:hypothetical protein